MKTPMRNIPIILAGLALLAAAPLTATPVTVQEVGIGANEIVTINSSTLGNNLAVYAGVVDLLVDGVPTQGFCIDPWHWSISGPQSYDIRPLAGAPKAPGPMDAATALKIEQLWQQFYNPAVANWNAQAAGLQIAIWELVDASVGSATFSLVSANDYNAGNMIAWVNSNPGAPAANLAAVVSLTHDSAGKSIGQDYVIPNVPDGGSTAVMLGLGLIGLGLVCRWARAA